MAPSSPSNKKNKGRHLFGTDGIRGVANIEPMTSEIALKLGRAVAHIFREPGRRDRYRGREDGVKRKLHRPRVL
ncbi:MAG: hypothetical protein ACE5FB_05850, partial [Candidatus Binatia bacterium]